MEPVAALELDPADFAVPELFTTHTALALQTPALLCKFPPVKSTKKPFQEAQGATKNNTEHLFEEKPHKICGVFADVKENQSDEAEGKDGEGGERYNSEGFD